MALEEKRTSGSVVKRLRWTHAIAKLIPGHNLSLGLRADYEDLGLSVDLCSSVALLEGVLTDFDARGGVSSSFKTSSKTTLHEMVFFDDFRNLL